MSISDSFAPDRGDGAVNAPPRPYQELTDDGAITIAEGVVFLNKAGVIAATIANPPVGMDGARLLIVSLTAQAHTVTYTAGFGGGTTSRDVATFGGAINDGLEIVAKDGVWQIAWTRNVTLG